ncbi:hypothetical protein ACFFRR_002028 [Megaselia abdita]
MASGLEKRNIWHIFWILIAIPLATGDDETKIYRDDDSKVLLDSYIPAAMQLLAYHLELLKYETLASTTVEPPFYGDGNNEVTTNRVLMTTTTQRPLESSSSTTQRPWWAQTTTKKRVSTTTPIPTPPPPPPSTTTQRPWWDQTTTKKRISTTTQKPWWTQTTTKKRVPTTTQKPWWSQTTTKKRISTTTQKPWWSQTTTKKRISTTTQKPWWSQTTTKKRISTTTQKPWSTTKKVWWVPTTTKKVIWWSPPSTPSPQRTTTKRPTCWWSCGSSTQRVPTTQNPQRTTKRPTTWWWGAESSTQKIPTTPRHAPAIFAPKDSIRKTLDGFLSGPSFLEWFHKPKAVALKSDIEYDFEVLDPLPASLVKEVDNELSELPAISDDDNVRVFLSKYDDSVRYQLNSAGKKKVPPAKPYVEFLILYDVMKRDTKAAKLENFQGYTKKMEHELYELSSRSSEVQLYYVFKRMLDGNNKKILRDDVVRRVQDILKDLENPNSATVKILRYIPPLNFIL